MSALLGLALSASGCEDREEPPAAEIEMMAPPTPGAVQPGSLEEDEEEVELMEGLPEERVVPLDEMDQPSLEAACFEGRQEACDRLGH